MATATANRLTPVEHLIRDGKEFDRVVAELDALAFSDPEEGSPAFERMELLAILVADYEERHLPPFEPSSLQEVVRFMADQKGLNPAQLAELFGGRPRMSDFFKGVRKLSRTQMITLRDSLGIPTDLLLGS